MNLRDLREPLLCLLPPIFRDCVYDDEDNRYSVFVPFSRDGLVYATDGRIIVWTKVSSPVEAILALAPERKVPNPEKLAALVPWHSEPTPLPDLPPKRECEYCGGKGACPCEVCRQLIKCLACEGDGERYTSDDRVRLGADIAIGGFYAEILKRHDAAIYLPTATGKPIRFVAGECEGLVMPLVSESEAERLAAEGRLSR